MNAKESSDYFYSLKMKLKREMIRLPPEQDIVSDNDGIDGDCTKLIQGKVICDMISSDETTAMMKI